LLLIDRGRLAAVRRWDLSRQDAAGGWHRVGSYADHVEAITAMLVLDAGVAARTYQIEGPAGRACPTIHDLRERLVDTGRRVRADGRSLSEFLRAWWLVSKRLSGARRLDLDTVAAWVEAAGIVAPPPLRPSWRRANLPGADSARRYADWQRVVISQIADLADLADQGPSPAPAASGTPVPRPPGRTRATTAVWHHLDPAAYLEAAMSGLPTDRAGVDDDRAPRHPVDADLSWADLTRLTASGQGTP
jgi:hypothetical protein